MNSNGEALFAWTAQSHNENNKTYEFDIKRRAYLQIDPETFDFEAKIPVINAITKGQQDQPAMACTDAGQSVVIWRDDMDKKNDHEIYGRAFDEMVIFE
ncbi:MAG: hypothetical protein J6A01_04465 [Proteobacteria bacterium]|nr:hypothetical protein [Pseudomonadota bacterium]